MHPTRRHALGAAVALLASTLPVAAQAETIRLADETAPGDCFRCEITLKVEGKMKVAREGKAEMLPLRAVGRHQFFERVEVGTTSSAAGKALRYYLEAQSESVVSVDKSQRTLGTDRRLIIAQRSTHGTLHYSPNGPLSRDELDLVAEQFDTLCIPGLLAEREVKIGDSWPIRNDIAQSACLFDGLIKNELTGKLVEVKDGSAVISIEGKAEGIEHGANVKLTIAARLKFDLAAKRVVSLNWEQTDERDQGPISPAVEVKASVSITRSLLAQEPKELDAATRAKVPADTKIPELLTHLRHTDNRKVYELVYPRDWHIVVNSDSHLILRLLDRGEFVAQATISNWKRAEGDRAAVVKDFIDATAKQPGWQPEKLIENGAIEAGNGRQVHRLVAAGKQDGLAVVQSFHLLTASDGQQLVITCLARQEQAAQIGTKDVAITNAIEFLTSK